MDFKEGGFQDEVNLLILTCDTKQVLKKDMMDPFGGGKLKVKDIIFMQKGGTGFAAGGTKLDTHKYTPTMRAY